MGTHCKLPSPECVLLFGVADRCCPIADVGCAVRISLPATSLAPLVSILFFLFCDNFNCEIFCACCCFLLSGASSQLGSDGLWSLAFSLKGAFPLIHTALHVCTCLFGIVGVISHITFYFRKFFFQPHFFLVDVGLTHSVIGFFRWDFFWLGGSIGVCVGGGRKEADSFFSHTYRIVSIAD